MCILDLALGRAGPFQGVYAPSSSQPGVSHPQVTRMSERLGAEAVQQEEAGARCVREAVWDASVWTQQKGCSASDPSLWVWVQQS